MTAGEAEFQTIDTKSRVRGAEGLVFADGAIQIRHGRQCESGNGEKCVCRGLSVTRAPIKPILPKKVLETSKVAPIVDADFVATPLYNRTQRGREERAPQNSNNAPEDKPNPLLSSSEAGEEKRRQEIVSSFLTGVAVAAICGGGIYLVFRYFSPCAQAVTEVAEEVMTTIN